MTPRFTSPKAAKKAMALVIVLTVIVLITILAAAFASVAMLERASAPRRSRVRDMPMSSRICVVRFSPVR